MAELSPAPHKTLRVAELNRYIKYVLESDDRLSQVAVEGEMSNISRSPSGHLYFSLKDDSSQVSCVLFRREAMRIAGVGDLHAGMAVLVRGFLTVYEPRGTVQIYVEGILQQGEGAHARRFEELRSRLEAEGLFSQERKRPLPAFPRKIALVTSPGSQAYHDVLHRLRTQFPFVTVLEAGASVQGEGSADEMAFALDIVNRLTDADVILLVRGGGAPEELAAFNDERLARAVFASRIPVVTGIGHEMDQTITDMVADHRAATPSLAAAAAVPDLQSLIGRMTEFHLRSAQIVKQRLTVDRRRLVHLNGMLLRCSPQNRLRLFRQRSEGLERSAVRAITLQVAARRTRLRSLEAQLSALDPTAVLARGYAMVFDRESGRAIRSPEETVAGMRLRVLVADGEFSARVEAE